MQIRGSRFFQQEFFNKAQNLLLSISHGFSNNTNKVARCKRLARVKNTILSEELYENLPNYTGNLYRGQKN